MRTTVVILLPVVLAAQDALTLREAVQLSLKHNQAIAATTAASAASDSRIAQARSGHLPKISYSESLTRSDNPVFVFSSLLTQRRFTEQNFLVGSLNRPDALSNFQSRITIDQPLFDAGQTRNALQSAELGRKISGEEQRRVETEVISGAARAYYAAVLASENLNAAVQALRSAEADLRRAEAIRAAGMSTDVDVLSIRVHLAAVNEQRINRAADLDIAKAALNDALGLPLDTRHHLATSLTPMDVRDMDVEALEKEASETRPESRQVHLSKALARTHADAARSAFLPQVHVHGALEADRQRFATRGGANWLAAVSLRWNVFNGFADKARMEEANHLVRRAEADQRRTDSAIRLQVRRAYAHLRAARQRIEVAKASVAEAEESLRITQNRYEAGIANVTDLLRNETAVLESRTRYLAAVHDQRVAATLVEVAAGRLSADSEVLN